MKILFLRLTKLGKKKNQNFSLFKTIFKDRGRPAVVGAAKKRKPFLMKIQFRDREKLPNKLWNAPLGKRRENKTKKWKNTLF